MDANSGLLGVVIGLLILNMASRGTKPTGGLHRKLDAILAHLNIDINAGIDPQLIEMLRTGKKIAAIKLYREQTGAGLKEAKDYVERLEV